MQESSNAINEATAMLCDNDSTSSMLLDADPVLTSLQNKECGCKSNLYELGKGDLVLGHISGEVGVLQEDVSDLSHAQSLVYPSW